MSMLADRKQKQKWSLNPRGNLWSQDGSKFGQKLLEKMGWSQGKGLGAKLDGMTEPVRVVHKSDSAGIGFKDTEGWTAHESNFSELLQNLAAKSENFCDKRTKLTSLEQTSQKSRKRVHYHKFTRGKDLSRYSEKDLASIFGKKSLKEAPKDVMVQQEKTEEGANDYGVETHNAGSMLDYFNKKLKGIANPAFDPLHGSVKMKKRKLDMITEDQSENNTLDSSGVSFAAVVSQECLDQVTQPVEVPKKKRKKVKDPSSIIVDSASIGIDNPSLDLSCIDDNASTTDQTKSDKKKKKKKRAKCLDGIDNPCLEPSYATEEHSTLDQKMSMENGDIEATNKSKKKKKKNKEKGVDNSGFQDNNLSISGIDILPDDSCQVEHSESSEDVSKVDKKQKKKRKKCDGIDNPCLDLDLSNDCKENAVEVVNSQEVKRGKKRRKDHIAEGETSAEVTDKTTHIKHKKRKSETKVSPLSGVDNPSFNLNNSSEVSSENDTNIGCDLMLNVCAIAVPEKPKTKDRGNAVKRRRSVRFSGMNEERIIPLDPDQPLITPSKGRDNQNFDLNTNMIEENVNSMAETIEQYQAEVENDLNEAKCNQMAQDELMVGEIGDPDGDNELLPSGETKLKLKHAKFGKPPSWMTNKTPENYAKKAYKHLIKGDIVVGFRNANLHVIKGYADHM